MSIAEATCWSCGVVVSLTPSYKESIQFVCTDCRIIVKAATDAIATARQVGVPKYGSTSWRHIDPSEHMLHAIEHMRLVGLGDASEAHLSHAICRLAMAKAILSE